LLTAIGEDSPVNFRRCGVSKETLSLELAKACGFDGIPNEYSRQLPRRPLVHLTNLFNHFLRFGHFPAFWKEANIRALPKPGKDPKFPLNLLPISPLSDRLCGLVDRVLGYRSGGPGSIPGTTKKNSGSGTGSTQPREYN
jgi:hypothetical protein